MDRRIFLKRVIQMSAAISMISPAQLLAKYMSGFSITNLPEGELDELWPRLLTKTELKNLTVFTDTILPVHGNNPAASQVGVVDFLNEWVSAPFEPHQTDLKLVRSGLTLMEKKTIDNFSKYIHELSETEKNKLIQLIIATKESETEKELYEFFLRFRYLTVGGYYTTEAGHTSLEFMGNTPLEGEFPGPPDSIIKKVLGNDN